MNKLYWEYFRFGDTAYRDKMRYFESHQKEIWKLDFEESTDISLDYLSCLFEVGRYERFLLFVDNMIETVMIENIDTYRGENIYFELLFKKAACLYHTGEYSASMAILKQLRKIDPTHILTIELYTLCHRKIPYYIVTNLRALTVASIIILIVLSVVRILLIEPFYAASISLFTQLQIGLIGLAALSFIASEIVFKVKIYNEIGAFPSGAITLIGRWIVKMVRRINAQ